MDTLTIDQAEAWLGTTLAQLTAQSGAFGSASAELAAVSQRRRELLARVGSAIRTLDDLQAALAVSPAAHQPEGKALAERLRSERAVLFDAMRLYAPDEAWFWTEEWQAGEREAEADVAAGRTTVYESDEAFRVAVVAHMHPPDEPATAEAATPADAHL